MLTDSQCRKAKAVDKAIKLADERGLYLYVAPSGLRSWRFKYRIGGAEKKLTFGSYPEVGLAEARERRDAARRALRDGIDPGLERRKKREEERAVTVHTVERTAREWHALNRDRWSERHADDVLTSLVRDIFPKLGPLAVRDVRTPQVLDMLRAIEARPAIETAKRVRQRLSAVFVYAISQGIADADPASVVGGALKPLRKGKQPAIVDLDQARKVLADAEAVPAHPATRLALRLLALTAVRPGELRAATWDEFEGLDGDEPLWRIPAARMKGSVERKSERRGDHLVPLSRQAVEVLKAAKIASGAGPLPFPNSRHSHKPMSENAIGYLLNRAGYHHRHVPHGWRATFSTVMNERFKPDSDVIELMLAHVPQNKVKHAYDRAAHLGRRRELAQLWADLITEGLPPAKDIVLEPRR